MNPSVTLTRGHDGKQPLAAKTKIDLGLDRRVLVIETTKASNGLRCTAYGVQVSQCGLFETRAFGSTGAADFRRDVAFIPAGRATEKAVLALHDQGLAKLEELRTEAHAYYAQQRPSAQLPMSAPIPVPA